MKQALKVVAAVGVLALVVAACAGEEEAAADICTADPKGCVTYGAGEPIKLGGLLAISGNVAFLGNDSVTGVKVAIDFLDGKVDGVNGKLLGRDVNFVVEDDLCSKEGGQAGSVKLAADPKIVGVIGTTCSSSALGVADKNLSDKGIVLYSPSNTNPNLTAQGTHQPFYLRTAHNDKIQGAIVAEFASKELQAKTAATINDESPYADALAAVFRQNFEKAGGKITDVDAIQSTDTDFRALLRGIAVKKPDVLYFPDFNPACALIAKQAREISGLAGTILVGSDGCLETAFIKTAGKALKEVYASGPDFAALKQEDFYANQFLPGYKRIAGTAPTAAFHAHAFDATTTLFNAIKQVAIVDGDTISIPRTKLKDELYGTKDHRGLSSVITCVPLGDCATAVTIAVYKLPEWPVEGGNPNATAVFSKQLTLAEAGG